MGEEVYTADIRCIIDAFRTDSKSQREKLVSALRETTFVMSISPHDQTDWISKPGDVYLATARLKELFSASREVLLVDENYACLCGKDARELLEACGAARGLVPVKVESNHDYLERKQLRAKAGCESSSGNETISDNDLRGLDELIAMLPSLEHEHQTRLASLLWEELVDLEDRRGAGVFTGVYEWMYHKPRSATFDAAFIRKLNASVWIPGTDGKLHTPSEMVFDALGWEPNAFLQSMIHFKPPIIEQLAREAGIDPEMLDLLKSMGVTSVQEFRRRFGIQGDESSQDTRATAAENCGEMNDDLGNEEDHLSMGDRTRTIAPAEVVMSETCTEPLNNPTMRDSDQQATDMAGSQDDDKSPGLMNKQMGKDKTKQSMSDTTRPFISYIAPHPVDEHHEDDPDGLTHSERMNLEASAIDFILKKEPTLQRTKANNPGFDLFEMDEAGVIVRWIEVKAMTGTLEDRPVCMSSMQFEWAREKRTAYWLYVVEHAGESQNTKVWPVNDPYGKAKSFTFDRGWRLVADLGEGIM